MADPAVPNGSPAEGKTSAWQVLLVLPALSSIGLGVLLPLWVLAVALSTALSVHWCEQRLTRLGVHSQELVGMAAIASAVLVLGGLGAACWERFQEALRQGPEAGPRKGWLVRHPWWTLGLLLVVADFLVPDHSSRKLLAATVLLAKTSWLILTAVWLAWWAAWASLRLGWRMSRASSFLAGLVVAVGFFTALGWFTFFHVIEEAARSAPTSFNRTFGTPRSAMGWSLDGRGPGGSASAPASSVPALFERQQHGALGVSTVRFGNSGDESEAFYEALGLGGGPPDGFSDCVLGLGSQLRREATSLARRYVDSFEAQDVVQEVLLRVCLRGRAPSIDPGYFIRSVENRALGWKRRAARVCSIVEAPETGCSLRPDEDYLREEQYRALNKALCTLSEADQEVIRLRYFEMEEYAHIAQRLGGTQVAARQRVSRAMERLRAAYRNKCL